MSGPTPGPSSGSPVVVRSTHGRVTVTPDAITIEGITAGRVKTIARSAVLGVDRRITIRPLFGKGGAMEFTIRTASESVAIKGVPTEDAKQLIAALGLPA
jgi:membrane protein YdbS with pleckstrin-like domain